VARAGKRRAQLAMPDTRIHGRGRSSPDPESAARAQRISGFVAELAADWLAVELQVRLKTVRQDLGSLVDFGPISPARRSSCWMRSLGFISIEQNDIFKVLTIVSVVGIPPTLIASMYGMNFHNMPELGWHWGYAYGLALIALSTLVPVFCSSAAAGGSRARPGRSGFSREARARR